MALIYNVDATQFVTKDPEQRTIDNDLFLNESKLLSRLLLEVGDQVIVTFQSSTADGSVKLTHHVSGDHLDAAHTISKTRCAKLGISTLQLKEDTNPNQRISGAAIAKRIRLMPVGDQNCLPENLAIMPWQNEEKAGRNFMIPAVDFMGASSIYERWRGVLEALTAVGGEIRISIRKFTPTGRSIPYAKQVMSVLQKNSDLLLLRDDLKRNCAIYRKIAQQDDLYLAHVEFSGTEDLAELMLGFRQDTDPDTLCNATMNPRLNTQNIAHQEIKHLIEHLPYLYTQEEVLELLVPPYTFGDVLPGLSHHIPKPFVKPAFSKQQSLTGFQLGRLPDGTPLYLDMEKLMRHVFINGMAGGGKSFTTFLILREVREQALKQGRRIPMLILDPAKTEYEALMRELGQQDQIIDFKEGRSLHFNPFIPQPNISVYSHAAILAKVFSMLSPTNDVAFEILRGMIWNTYLFKLKKALDVVSLEQSLKVDGAFLRSHPECIPTFHEFLHFGMEWLKRSTGHITKEGKPGQPDRWGQEAVQHFERRWDAMRTGLCAFIFSGTEPVDRYFESDYLIEFYNIIDPSESNTLCALMVALLHEYRLSQGLHDKLQHLTVLEEAHRIIPSQQAGLGENRVSSPAHEAALLLAQMLAEIRAFGEGLIIIDQSPSKIMPDVLINCSTKIIHRTQYGKDKDALASALSLAPREVDHLSFLATGEAIIYIADASQPAYVQITRE